MREIVVVSCIFGDGLKMHSPECDVDSSSADFFFHTDQPLYSYKWRVIRCPKAANPQRETRRLKAPIHRHYPGHGWSIWVDSRYALLMRPEEIVSEVEALGADIAVLRHKDRDNIIDEAAEIIRLGKAPVDDILSQLRYYLEIGWGRDMTTLSTGGFIVRRNTRLVRQFNELWWLEIQRGSLRDQMSLDYSAHMTGVKIHHLPGTCKDNRYCRMNREKTLCSR